MPEAPAPGSDFSRTTMSSPEPRPRARNSFARWYAVESPWMPAPITTWGVALWAIPLAIVHTQRSMAARRKPAGRRIAAVERAVAVLDELAGEPAELGTNELARRIGVNPSTAS